MMLPAYTLSKRLNLLGLLMLLDPSVSAAKSSVDSQQPKVAAEPNFDTMERKTAGTVCALLKTD